MNVMEKFSLKGFCSIVTGAAMSLGKAMAEALADAGSDIVIADILLDEAEKTADELRSKGVRVSVIKCDVTSPADADNLVMEVIDIYGRIDVLINNAGICIHEKAENMKLEDWKKVMAVNLDGVFIMSQSVGRAMISRQSGSIINISSMSGIIANTPQCQCSYNASKAGVIMLTKSLASEWASHNIRVNAIAPGYMKTELTRPYFEGNSSMVKQWMDFSPLKRPGTPDELGGIAVYLASAASSFTTGSVFVIDGGYTVW
jgi:NAD(P)-dependent dehydrogenase (short-subunit alcohol dehydrogenase family)